MKRTYGIDKEYARERAIAHHRKYGGRHWVMLFQVTDFDGTMEIVRDGEVDKTEWVDLDQDFNEIRQATRAIRTVFPAVEEINDEEVPY